jgi:hypothetical protein
MTTPHTDASACEHSARYIGVDAGNVRHRPRGPAAPRLRGNAALAIARTPAAIHDALALSPGHARPHGRARDSRK